MTLAKKLYEVLVLGLIWGTTAAAAVAVIAKVEQIAGGERTAYGLLAALVVGAWFATEYALEALGIDTSYTPE